MSRKRLAQLIGYGVLGFVALMIIGLIVVSGSKTKKSLDDNIGTQASDDPSDVASDPDPAKSAQYVLLTAFEGNGAKTFEPFTVTGSRFKIKYNCTGDLCQAFLYKVGGNELAELIMNTTGAVSDETTVYQTGQFYIKSNSLGSYSFAVEDYK